MKTVTLEKYDAVTRKLINQRGELQEAMLHLVKSNIEEDYPELYNRMMNYLGSIYTNIDNEITERKERLS